MALRWLGPTATATTTAAAAAALLLVPAGTRFWHGCEDRRPFKTGLHRLTVLVLVSNDFIHSTTVTMGVSKWM